MTPESHTIDDVIDYLNTLTQRGIVGSMEISLHQHRITNIRHTENHRPGALPQPVVTPRPVTT